MKAFNFIVLNLNLNFIKSNILAKDYPSLEDPLFDLGSSYQFINDPSDLLINENIETHNQNSAQTPNHDQFIDDTLISNPIIQNNIASDFNPINSDLSSKRMRIHYNNSPSSYISSTPSHFPIEPIHAQETQSSTSTHHSSRFDEFNSNLITKFSPTAATFVSNLQYHPIIPFNHQTFGNQKLRVPSPPINSNIEIKSPAVQSEPKQKNIESSTSPFSKPQPYSGRKYLYNWINFEPKEIDGIVVLKSINSLELPDGTKFFNLPEFNDNSQDSTKIDQSQLNHKILCLKTSDVRLGKKFFTTYWGKCVQIRNKRANDYEAIASERKESTWAKLASSSDKSGSIPKEVLQYKRFALPDFDEKIQEIKQFFITNLNVQLMNEKNVVIPSGETIPDLEVAKPLTSRRRKISRQITLLMKNFNRAMLLFPYFVLYVDLINTILPEENFDKLGNTLRAQRKIAGDGYLQLVKYLINDKYKIVHPEQIPIGQIDKLTYDTKKTLFSTNNKARMTFVWEAIYYWMVNSRPEILDIAIDERPISTAFRSFFAQSIESWCLSAK